LTSTLLILLLYILLSTLMYLLYSIFFFFNDTAPTEIYTLSLHDALPIYIFDFCRLLLKLQRLTILSVWRASCPYRTCKNVMHERSEEHTSELQSRGHLVCRLLLEKKKN